MYISNLINPIAPHQQLAWKRWLRTTTLLCIFLAFVLSSATGILCWKIYGIQEQLHEAQNNTDMKTIKNNEQLQGTLTEVNKKLATVCSWTNVPYQLYLKSISTTIPNEVMLTSLEIDGRVVLMHGKAFGLEYLLTFLHNLEQTKLFHGMNLTQLHASTVTYETKNLVNFTIKGTLIEKSPR